jgi:hypothetical protein
MVLFCYQSFYLRSYSAFGPNFTLCLIMSLIPFYVWSYSSLDLILHLVFLPAVFLHLVFFTFSLPTSDLSTCSCVFFYMYTGTLSFSLSGMYAETNVRTCNICSSTILLWSIRVQYIYMCLYKYIHIKLSHFFIDYYLTLWGLFRVEMCRNL